jgi:predicted component of viral defense system (DUF524 family)
VITLGCIKYSEIKDNYVFNELTDYYIEFDTKVIEDRDKNNGIMKWISSNIAKVNFGNSIGKFDLMGKLINVTSEKISAEKYEEMLAEITNAMEQLPFDFNKPTYEEVTIDAFGSNNITYHTFLVLRYIILNSEENLEGAFESIFKNPSRKNEHLDLECNVWEANSLTPKTIISMLSNPQNLEAISNASSLRNTSIAGVFKGTEKTFYFPMKVNQTKVINSVDTPENRFIKFFLKYCHDRLHNIKVAFKDIKCICKLEIDNDIKTMIEIVEELLSNHFFDEVGEMISIPFNSTVLQKRSGYKEVRHFYDLMQSSIRIPVFEDKLKIIIENKDVAELYEMWTYFEVVKIVETLMGISPVRVEVIRENDFKAYMQKGIAVVFKTDSEEIKVWYNKIYGRKSGSYSLPLRPDIVVDINGELYIFDAKFKLESLMLSEVEDEKDFTFKNGDLYKMHTYKDAIEGVKFAGILYPNPNSDVADLFWEDESEIVGVGAIPLVPGGEAVGLKEILVRVLNVEAV